MDLQDILNKKCLFFEKSTKNYEFCTFNARITPLFKNCKILNFADIINVQSYVFINNCFIEDSFSIFNGNFKLVSTTHSYNTRSVRNGLLFVPSYNSVRFARKLSIQPLLIGFFFLTAIWLSHSQLRAILEGTASLT